MPTQNKERVSELIKNEQLLYLEPHHGKRFMANMWDIASAVQDQRLLRITYRKLNAPDPVTRLVQPAAIMFSEFYFYLIAYICEDEHDPDKAKYPYPAVYRIDRIDRFSFTDIRFRVPYTDRFQPGEFRKRVQFMFSGPLKTVRFRYWGPSIESVLDRLPTAQVRPDPQGDGWLVCAEVYGNGVDIWLRGQGDNVQLLPEDQ